jgi:hypothetical protein
MTCLCFDPRVFGHLPTCPVEPQPWPACGVTCTPQRCAVTCAAWQVQRSAFGWPRPPRDAGFSRAVAPARETGVVR